MDFFQSGYCNLRCRKFSAGISAVGAGLKAKFKGRDLNIRYTVCGFNNDLIYSLQNITPKEPRGSPVARWFVYCFIYVTILSICSHPALLYYILFVTHFLLLGYITLYLLSIWVCQCVCAILFMIYYSQHLPPMGVFHICTAIFYSGFYILLYLIKICCILLILVVTVILLWDYISSLHSDTCNNNCDL